MLVSATTKTKQHRGAFVVLEGMDRAGKTTQLRTLFQRMVAAGVAVSSMRFPDRTTQTGKLIDSYLKTTAATKTALDDRAVHLLFSSNRWEAADAIAEQLGAGTTILCDRYAFSGVAFSSAKVDEQNNQLLSTEWCQGPDRGLPCPDCVIFLDLSPEKAQERGGYGEERYETAEMQRRVRERFTELEKLTTSENNNDNDVPMLWRTVDAGRTQDEVQSDIWNIVQDTVQRVQQSSSNDDVGGGDGDGGDEKEEAATAKPIAKLWEEGIYECKSSK